VAQAYACLRRHLAGVDKAPSLRAKQDTRQKATKAKERSMRYLEAVRFSAGVIGAALLSGCSATEGSLAPRPAVFATPQNEAAVSSTQPAVASHDLNLLYITDRAKIVDPQTGAFSYGSERSYTMSFGSIDVRVEPDSTGAMGEMKLTTIQEIGRFPEVPYAAKVTSAGYRRAPDVVAAHEEAVATLQDEIRRRLANTKRKEVVVFVHGYNNTFSDAASATGNLCRLLGPDFVCVILTWPAGGKRGAFMGYDVDIESAEFAVSEMRKAIRAIGETPGLRALDLIAHSRGTDVLASVFHLLGVETYVSRASIAETLKVRNIVLFAPDIDIDVATAKIFDVFSDPDEPYGAKKNPNATIKSGALHLTIYSSPGDQALGLSSSIFGSRLRLGQLHLTGPEAKALRADPGHFADLIEVDENLGAFGHGYFLSNSAVRSDLVALIRYGLKPGDPGRPLVKIGKAFWRIPADNIVGSTR
jgi:esterase/lipase superfamily enzyme